MVGTYAVAAVPFPGTSVPPAVWIFRTWYAAFPTMDPEEPGAVWKSDRQPCLTRTMTRLLE